MKFQEIKLSIPPPPSPQCNYKGRGWPNKKFLKKSMELNWNFWRGEGVQTENTLSMGGWGGGGGGGMDIFWNWNLFRPAHNTCEFWDQSNSLGMDHTTNQAPPHLLGHDLHCCLDFDFLVVTGLLRGHHFDLLK